MGSFQRVSGAVVAAVGVVVLATSHPAKAQQASILHWFPQVAGAAPDGSSLNGGLSVSSTGLLFGTAQYGGDANLGTVYSFDLTSGQFMRLASFDFNQYGARPTTGVIANGNFATGATPFGGTFGFGTVYTVANQGAGQLQGLEFADSAYRDTIELSSNLVTNANRSYGTFLYSEFGGGGGIFQFAQHTTQAVYNLTPADGLRPGPVLVGSASGALFGTTYGGGASDSGTFFQYSPNTKVFTTLASMPSINSNLHPNGSLAVDASGNLFGLNSSGVYEVDAATHTFSQWLNFSSTLQAHQVLADLSIDSAGNLYGATEWEVFRIDAASRNLSILASAEDVGGTLDGITHVNLASDGKLYGTTGPGYDTMGMPEAGTLFEIALPEPSAILFAGVGLLGLLRRRIRKTH